MLYNLHGMMGKPAIDDLRQFMSEAARTTQSQAPLAILATDPAIYRRGCMYRGTRAIGADDRCVSGPGRGRAVAGDGDGERRDVMTTFSKLGQRMGLGAMRVMTDVSAERYWTVVSEREEKNLEEDIEMTRKSMKNKDFQEAMQGYDDLVDHGRREIYTLEM